MSESCEEVATSLSEESWRHSESEQSIDVVNPSNGQRWCSIPAGCVEDANRAVEKARVAFDKGNWSGTPSLRKDMLLRLADEIAAHATELDSLDAREMGKPIRERTFDAKAAAELMRFYAEAVDKVTGEVYVSGEHTLAAQRRVPRGVVAAITPWNFPTYNAVLKAAPALAAGNCVVLKPSELSSLSAMRIGALATRVGVPTGVLNVVPGLGATVGKTMALHRDVDMLTFTGSTAAGKLMLQYSGQSNMKPVLAECGGKSPQIVFADGVDLDAVSDSVAHMIVTNQGQICSAGSRLLVERSIEKELVDRIVRRFERVTIGDALDPNTTFGPLASERQRTRVMQYIEAGKENGCTIVTGGRQVLPNSGGFFVEPTLFCDVAPSARIAHEEIFGPVLSVIRFDDEADAIRIANSTVYGLMAYVWTTNLARGMRVSKAIRSSVVVNAAAPTGEGSGNAAPWEPAGESGVGTEGGMAGMSSYLRRQSLWFNHGPTP